MKKLISVNAKYIIEKLFNITQLNKNYIYSLKKHDEHKRFSKNFLNNNTFILIGSFIKILFKNSNIFFQINDFCITTLFSIKSLLKIRLFKLKVEEIYKVIYKIIVQKKYLNQNNIAVQIISSHDFSSVFYFLEHISSHFHLIKVQYFKNYSFNGCRKKKWLSWFKAVNCKFIKILS